MSSLYNLKAFLNEQHNDLLNKSDKNNEAPLESFIEMDNNSDNGNDNNDDINNIFNNFNDSNNNDRKKPISFNLDDNKSIDDEIKYRTHEHKRSALLDLAIPGIKPIVDKDIKHIQNEENKNDYIKHVEDIEQFLTSQEIPFNKGNRPDKDDDIEKWISYFDILKSKIRSLKLQDIFDGMIIFVTKVVEDYFDGQNEFFGYRPDLKDWSEVAKIKFKRLKVENSMEISRFIKRYNISDLSLFFIEMFISLFGAIIKSDKKKIKKRNDNYITSYKPVNSSVASILAKSDPDKK